MSKNQMSERSEFLIFVNVFLYLKRMIEAHGAEAV